MPTAPRRLLVALAFGFAGAALAYVALRLIESVWFPEPDPAIVIWSDRSRFVWRALLAAYAGGAAIFGGHALATRSIEAAAVWLGRVSVAAALALALQGALVP
ncbi:hypothetical protein [Polyangium jinanense]|uniref:Uncharacterized protein n=1 Tax=Polyangium jinanense TaxID=2829994 RepID=A0A9X3WZK1_9BACT|nr:hypothetical protein [Polyangium jinanense]MDC3954711.1 hypothetical protein [Polyangium jinanense]MDC3981014.1 hypothetical protein [Polyangium jinanense]